MKRSISILLCAGAVIAGCGGDDGDDSREDAARDAESTVRGYLTALVEKNGGEACSRFTREYQQSVLKQNESFAKQNRARNCTQLIDAITRASPSVSFENEILNEDNVGEVGLETRVRQSGDEWNGTVTGKAGIQRYELETRDGKWLITKIERTR
jgi:hypothetical protein